MLFTSTFSRLFSDILSANNVRLEKFDAIIVENSTDFTASSSSILAVLLKLLKKLNGKSVIISNN